MAKREPAGAELICVGSELLAGKVNTHSAYLAPKLAEMGLSLRRETTVPDDEAAIRGAIRDALSRSEVVLVSGGLGPTFDDLTREGAAGALRKTLRTDPRILSRIRAKFKKYRLQMPEENSRQAMVLPGARVIQNHRGSAPGQLVRVHARGRDSTLVLMPGPFPELGPMFETQIAPILRRLHSGGLRRRTLVLRVAGLMESEVDERVRPIVSRPDGALEFTILAGNGQVELHATAIGRDPARLSAALGRVRNEVQGLLGDNVFGEDADTLESVLGELLRRRAESLSVAESCTGGLLAGRLTNAAGSSDYFLGGVVAYANEVKRAELGVSRDTLGRYGAVSEQCAREMAAGVRAKTGSDWGLSVTGIAGPDGGTPDKPVGLVFLGLSGPKVSEVRKHRFPGDRARVRALAVTRALDLLRRALSA